MAILYGSLERTKRNLFIETSNVTDDTRLTQILTDMADFINLRLKSAGVEDPATSVATDPTIDRIASEMTAAKYRMERHQDTREFGFGGQRGGVRMTAWDIALAELQIWINITQEEGRHETGTFEMVKIEGTERIITIPEED